MIKIDESELYRLYITEQQNTRQVAKAIGCSRSTVSRLLKNCNIPARNSVNIVKYSKNDDYFNLPNINNSYWAGFIAADGCINDRISNMRLHICIHKQDKDVLERFKKDTEFDGKISIINNNYLAININQCKKWAYHLNKYWNITPRKSYSLEPPNLYDLNLQLSYICGIIDGDGCISIYSNKRNPNHKIINLNIRGTQSLLCWIRDILYNLEDRNKYINKKIIESKIADCYSLTYSHQRAINLLDILNKIDRPYIMNRKWDKISIYKQSKVIF